MVDECGKALLRRVADVRFSTRWFVGKGISFCEAENLLKNFEAFLPSITELHAWKDSDGDAALVPNVDDETYDFVHSANLLEHLSAPEVALYNWIRICKINGHLIISVPDEDRYEQGVFPSQFNPGHKWTFTIKKNISWSPRSISILDLLRRYSRYVEILKIEVLDSGFVYDNNRRDQTSQGLAESAIEIVLRKVRPPHLSITEPLSKRVLLRRWWAMGDCIMVTPVINRLRSEMGKDVKIDIITGQPKVFEGASGVTQVNPEKVYYYDYDRVIDLDGVYEASPHLHVIDAYMVAVFGDAHFPSKETFLYQKAPSVEIDIKWDTAVTLHAGHTHRARMMPRTFWNELISLLVADGLTPVIVGGAHDQHWPDTRGVVDCTNKYNINETAWIIGKSACFFSCDTGVMHIAGTTETPIVTIYTSVRPEVRMRWRYGELGWRTTALIPDVECIGCHCGDACNRNDFACVEGAQAITPFQAFCAIRSNIEKYSLMRSNYEVRCVA